MKKQIYKQPFAELLEGVLATAILDGSIEGDLPSYGDDNDFVW